MKPEVIKWYADKGFNKKTLIRKRANGVKPTQIIAAMKWCYENYNGKTIGLGHKVQEVAVKIRDEEEIAEELELAQAQETAMYFKKKYEELKHYSRWGIGGLLWFISLMGFYCYMITVR